MMKGQIRARLWGPAAGQTRTDFKHPCVDSNTLPSAIHLLGQFQRQRIRGKRGQAFRDPPFQHLDIPTPSVMNKHLHPLTWIFRRHKCKSPHCDAIFTLPCMSWAWATVPIPADQKVSLNSWRHVRTHMRVFKGSDSKNTSRIIIWRNPLLVCAWERIYETAKWQHDGRKHQRGATCFCVAQIVWEETQASAQSVLEHSKYTW